MRFAILIALGAAAPASWAVRCDPQLTSAYTMTADDVDLAAGIMNRHAVVAYTFATQLGHKLFTKVVKRAENLNVVIAMGGAEHLHSYLRARAHYAGRKDVRFFPLYLTRAMVQPWTARETSLPYPGRETRFEFGLEDIRSHTDQAERVLEFIKQSGVLSGGDIVVVDTGFNGTIVEVLASAVRHFGSKQRVRGVLVARNPPELVTNTVPIEALGSARSSEDKLFSPRWWAHFLDEGPPELHWTDPDEVPEELRYWASYEPAGLQRSCASPDRLIRIRGNWGPNTEPTERREDIRKWKDAVVGMTLAARLQAKINSPATCAQVALEIRAMTER